MPLVAPTLKRSIAAIYLRIRCCGGARVAERSLFADAANYRMFGAAEVFVRPPQTSQFDREVQAYVTCREGKTFLLAQKASPATDVHRSANNPFQKRENRNDRRQSENHCEFRKSGYSLDRILKGKKRTM